MSVFVPTRLAGLAVFAVCAIAAPASAQTCLGRGSFTDSPWQARVESSYSNSTKSYGPSIALGSRTFFAGALADLVGYPDLDQSAVSVGGTVGAEAAIGGRASRVRACPVVTFLHQFGPNVPDGENFSSNVTSAGGHIGVVASENETLQVVPMFGMDVEYERDMANATDASGASAASSRTFTVTRLGVGFVLNRRTAIVPEIIQIYGAASDTTIRVTASFGFGKR